MKGVAMTMPVTSREGVDSGRNLPLVCCVHSGRMMRDFSGVLDWRQASTECSFSGEHREFRCLKILCGFQGYIIMTWRSAIRPHRRIHG